MTKWNVELVRNWVGENSTATLLSETYKNPREHLLFKCQCGKEFKRVWPAFRKSQGMCYACSKKKPSKAISRSPEDFAQIFVERYPSEYTLASPYTAAREKVCIYHATCGKVFSARADHVLEGVTCPFCNTASKGELAVAEYLVSHGINYVEQFRLKGSQGAGGGTLIADFFLPDYSTVIEFDGKQHYTALPIWGGEAGFASRKYNDRQKDLFCARQGYYMLRIGFYDFDFIDDILDLWLLPEDELSPSWVG